ncbi:MAG: hypothetical protein HOE90_18175 [Bacteriovoracaceae bacterium]|jgi:hypothetical protein|nr:hypothetical protein [Bacteriovoracaceae bacterium]
MDRRALTNAWKQVFLSTMPAKKSVEVVNTLNKCSLSCSYSIQGDMGNCYAEYPEKEVKIDKMIAWWNPLDRKITCLNCAGESTVKGCVCPAKCGFATVCGGREGKLPSDPEGPKDPETPSGD